MITQTCSMLFLVVLDNLESSQELELLSNQLLKEYASFVVRFPFIIYIKINHEFIY